MYGGLFEPFAVASFAFFLFRPPVAVPASSSRSPPVCDAMALPSPTGPWRRRPALSLATTAALLAAAVVLLLGPPLAAEATPVDTPGRAREAGNDAFFAATAAAPGAHPHVRPTVRSADEAPPLVVDRGEYGGGWGAPQPPSVERQEMVVVDVSVPPRT